MTCKLCDRPDKPIKSRGLCKACYDWCSHQTKHTRATWATIVAAGYADEAHNEAAIDSIRSTLAANRTRRWNQQPIGDVT